jgi:hypothetical protein
MAREFNNYGELKDAVADWLNRDDLRVRIPSFIYMGERKIFRRYRNPNNEKTVTYKMRVNPQYDSAGSSSIGTELALLDYIQLSADYLETLTLQENGKPITRKSLTEMQSLRESKPQVGRIRYYARERARIIFWPTPNADVDIRMIYYCDMSGLLSLDTDDNDVLRTAPDLYLYGALTQAEPFLRASEEEMALVQLWKGLFEEAFTEIEFQRDEDERSGSNVSVKSAYHK